MKTRSRSDSNKVYRSWKRSMSGYSRTNPACRGIKPTYAAIQYCLNQWKYLIAYCQDGRYHISNALAENAIRPFAVGRKAWLFADSSKGAYASATCYSLIETAKANGLEPFAIRYVIEHIGNANTLEKLEALLPWHIDLEKASKKCAAVWIGEVGGFNGAYKSCTFPFASEKECCSIRGLP